MNQIFKYTENGDTYYFDTVVNGEGYYIEHNNTMLGRIHNSKGLPLGTARLDYTRLKPVPFSEVNSIFPKKGEKLLNDFCY